MKFKRLDKLTPKIRITCGLTIILIILVITAFVSEDSSYFSGSIVPEMIGVCIELLVVIWVIDRWQENIKRARLITKERRLREYLIFFLKHNFIKFPRESRIGNFYGKEHNENTWEINMMINHIDQNKLDEETISLIEEHCIMELSTLNSLLPVAAELSNDHFKSWTRIVYYVNSISNKKGLVSSNVANILKNINRFDRASFNGKLYVGAIKT